MLVNCLIPVSAGPLEVNAISQKIETLPWGIFRRCKLLLTELCLRDSGSPGKEIQDQCLEFKFIARLDPA